MKLKELIKNIPDCRVIGNADISIRGISYDSRQVGRCFIFAAIAGKHFDGRKFVSDAVKNGAVALITEEPVEDVNAVQIIVNDSREAMAIAATAFYGYPCRDMTIVGVTGTNGKTTVTYLIESIFKTAGLNTGVLGTINYRYKDKVVDAPHTTPESPDLQRIFRDMADSDVTHCVAEVSSHSLAQKRVLGSRFVGGVFTNLTQDHLDYHKTMDEYFESKSILFTDYVAAVKGGFSVINADDQWGLKLNSRLKIKDKRAKTIRYSLKHDTEIKVMSATFTEKGIDAYLNTPIGSMKISSVLLGEYNLQNIMAAIGVGICLELDKKIIEDGIASLKRVPGRLERIISEYGFQTVVDYAHTGDALERVLNTLRPLTSGRLITVFGCGGDRDRGKRPIMGEISTRLSDFTIITSDNPRDEDPIEIIREIEKGIKNCAKVEIEHLASKSQYQESRIQNQENILPYSSAIIPHAYAVISDRHEAIKFAISMAVSKDIILVAGKGHEGYQIIGDRKFPFDDTKEIKTAMEAGNNYRRSQYGKA